MSFKLTYRFITRNLTIWLKILISFFSISYIIYRISDEFNYIRINHAINSIDEKSSGIIGLCLVLMPVNWLIESYKWKVLLEPFEKISIRQSVKSVLFGLTSSIFTPYRLGEYVGRPLLISKQNRVSSVFALFIGSLAQSMITIGMAVFGLFLFEIKGNSSGEILPFPNLVLAISILSLCLLVFLFSKPGLVHKIASRINFMKKWLKKIEFLDQYSLNKLIKVLIYSQLRYIVFFTQYFFLLNVFNVNISLENAFIAVSLSYLFLFSIPGIPLAEPGIRGSLALFFIGFFSDNDFGILAASLTLWILNLAIPSLIGVFCCSVNNKT